MMIRNHTHIINTHKSNQLDQQVTNHKPPTEPTSVKTLLRNIHQDTPPPIQAVKENNTRPNNFFTMFANLKNCNTKYFLQTFMHHLSALKAEITKPTAKVSGISADEYVSDEQKSRLADTITDQISKNWNDFINTLNIDKNTKDQYFVPASNKNILDVNI